MGKSIVFLRDDQKPVADLPLKIESLRTGRFARRDSKRDQEGRFTVKASVGRWLMHLRRGNRGFFNLLANKQRPSQNMSIDPKSCSGSWILIEPGHRPISGFIIDPDVPWLP